MTTAALIDAWLRDRYEFLDATAGHDGLFQLDWGATRAWAARRRLGPKVFVSAPWYYRVAARWLPSLPQLGQPIQAWSLHHIGADGPEAKRVLDYLLAAIAWVAHQEGVAALVLPLFEDDFQAAHLIRHTLMRWGLGGPAARLYVRGQRAAQVLTASRPLLMSGRDE